MKNNRYVFIFLFMFAFGAIAAYASPVHEIEKEYEREGYNYGVKVQFYNRSNANQVLQMVWNSLEEVNSGPTEDGFTMKVVTERELKLANRAFNDIKNDREFRDWARDADYFVMIYIMNLKTSDGESYVVTRETVGNRELIKTKAWLYQKSAQRPQSQAPSPQPQARPMAQMPQQQSQPQNAATAKSYYDSGYDAYWKKKDYNKAIADFTEAIRLDPNYIIAYTSRANAYIDKGDYDKAIADYTQAIRLRPNDAFLYGHRGDIYNKKGNYDRAIADYTEAIRINPDGFFYRVRASSYIGKGDYDKAIADCNEALLSSSQRNSPDAYKQRAQAYIGKRDYKQARADVNKALQLNPNYQEAKDLDAELKKMGY